MPSLLHNILRKQFNLKVIISDLTVMENVFPLVSKFADGIIIVLETKLTCINKKLIGDPGVIHIMNCSCKNRSKDFQISEDSLGRKKRNLSEKSLCFISQ